MNAKIKTSAGLALAAILGAAEPASGQGAASTNSIRTIEVSERGGGVEVEIAGSRPPAYTVFKLQDPSRLVVDLAEADLSAVSSPIKVDKGGVISVATAQYQDQKRSVGRVILTLEGAARYEVTPRGEAVVVRVSKDQPAATQTTAVTAPVRPERDPSTGSISPESTAPASSTRPASLATPTGAADDGVVSRRLDETRVKHPANAITAVHPHPNRVEIQGNGQFSKFEVIELRSPPRLAIDLYGLHQAPRNPVAGGAGFKQVRFGKDNGKVRVVLDAGTEMPRYQVKRTPRGLAVLAMTSTTPIDRPVPTEKVESRSAPRAPELQSVRHASPAARATAVLTSIRDIRFNQSNGVAHIEIMGKTTHAVSRPDPRTLVLSLDQAQLPRRLERSLDTSAFNGPVIMVSSFNQPSTGQAKIVVTLNGGEFHDEIGETKTGLSWTVNAGPTPQHDTEQPVVITDSTPPIAQAAGFAAEAPSYAATGAPQKREYTGRRITLEFHDIEVRNLLRYIAEISKKNIVVADSVSGKVSLSLRNVPWDQALDIVLKAKGLGKEEMGNVIRIAKIEEIAKEQQALADAAKARAPLVPLKVRLIPVNYATARELEKQVKDVLTERGSVTIDERTNVLIVKDTQEALARAEGLVRNLDTETPQVLIESRIIEASSNFTQALGVQWGGNSAFTQATGNPTGLTFPNNVNMTGAAGGGPTTGTASSPNYAVNLPVAIGQGAGGGIGFTFGSVNGAFNLNLRLSALENKGLAKTISAPKISTIDNKEATIGQGYSIPFSTASQQGTNTVFIEAKLELKVTPHVTADGSVLMKIKASNNQPDASLAVNGQPSITKREAETSVLVKDGDTTVIGGIYTRQTTSQTAQVPFFAKIPVLGFFFRSQSDLDNHTELLIFITPHILNRTATSVAAGG